MNLLSAVIILLSACLTDNLQLQVHYNLFYVAGGEKKMDYNETERT